MNIKRKLAVFMFTFVVDIIDLCQGCPHRCECRDDKVVCSEFKPKDLVNISAFVPLNTKKLYLLDGGVEQFPVKDFKQLKHLEYLSLYTNKIKSMPKMVSNVFPSMKNLRLSKNDIENLTLLEGYHNIQALRLDSNNIKKILPYTFKGTQKLKELSLQKNKIETISEFAFFGLQDLRKLDLRDNLIRSIHERAFFHVPNVEEILLDANKLVTIPNNMFVRNKNLKRLSLPDNQINSIGDRAFTNLTIETISLRSNKFVTLPDQWLSSVKINHKVYMTNNYFLCNCDLMIRLRTSLRDLYKNNKLSLGNCYTSASKQKVVSTLRMDDFNCSACDIKPCPTNSVCVVTSAATYEYECKTIDIRTDDKARVSLPSNSPGVTSRENTLVLWVSISVSFCILVLCALLLWFICLQRRRRKSTFNVSDVSNVNDYEHDDVARNKNTSSINLILVTATKEYDNDVLLYST